MKNGGIMKYVSILGDSVSTYEGMNPPGYAVFYDKEMQKTNELLSVEDTWWSRVISRMGAKLCVNGSFSGSRVSGSAFPAGCSDERIQCMRDDEHIPDLILVYLGYNDFGKGVEINAKRRHLFGNPDLESFADAYNEMLLKLRKTYSKACIVCGTLMRTVVRGHEEWQFPEEFAGVPFDKYNEEIRKACRRRRVYLADIEKSGLRYETLDGSHPTGKGHTTLADAWMQETKRNGIVYEGK